MAAQIILIKGPSNRGCDGALIIRTSQKQIKLKSKWMAATYPGSDLLGGVDGGLHAGVLGGAYLLLDSINFTPDGGLVSTQITTMKRNGTRKQSNQNAQDSKLVPQRSFSLGYSA
jgi:hypothetical protein